VKVPIINQVRIAVIVSQSLLKKSVKNGDIPQGDADAVMYHLTRALELVKPHVTAKGTED
jgi:hypothetical protein